MYANVLEPEMIFMLHLNLTSISKNMLKKIPECQILTRNNMI